jgi:hypothetical protein
LDAPATDGALPPSPANSNSQEARMKQKGRSQIKNMKNICWQNITNNCFPCEEFYNSNTVSKLHV